MSKIRNDHLLRARQWSDLDPINIMTSARSQNFLEGMNYNLQHCDRLWVFCVSQYHLCKWLDIRRWLSGNGWGVVWMWTHCGSLALNNNPPLDARRGGEYLALLALLALLLVDQQGVWYKIQCALVCSSDPAVGRVTLSVFYLTCKRAKHCFGFLIKHYKWFLLNTINDIY